MSFRDRMIFNMLAGQSAMHADHIVSCNDKKILKGAFVFGANAGGKSNFIKAIHFMKRIVTHGLTNTNCEKKYFRIEEAYKDKPGIFQVDIFQNKHFYSYGFSISYDTASIVEEWLYQIDNPQDEFCVFSRIRDDSNKGFNVETDIDLHDSDKNNRLSIYMNDISSEKMNKILFLTDMAVRIPDDSAYQPFKDVVDWFNQIFVIFPDYKYGAITQLVENMNEKMRLENLLYHFDTGISAVQKREVDFDKAFSSLAGKALEQLRTNLSKNLEGNAQGAFVQEGPSLVEVQKKNNELVAYEVVSDHGNTNDLFEYSDESDGTQRLFDLIPVYQVLVQPAVVFIDELDRSLHTKATQKFINYFYELTKGIPSQLIATTHDSNVMDLNLLRRDEIWFVERKRYHESVIYSLNKFKRRINENAEKEYLLGRYGALPVFKSQILDDEDEDNENK